MRTPAWRDSGAPVLPSAMPTHTPAQSGIEGRRGGRRAARPMRKRAREAVSVSQTATSGGLTDEPVAEIVQCGEPTRGPISQEGHSGHNVKSREGHYRVNRLRCSVFLDRSHVTGIVT
jgi:hypothetical protein